jgi:hypothetical protein
VWEDYYRAHPAPPPGFVLDNPPDPTHEFFLECCHPAGCAGAVRHHDRRPLDNRRALAPRSPLVTWRTPLHDLIPLGPAAYVVQLREGGHNDGLQTSRRPRAR